MGVVLLPNFNLPVPFFFMLSGFVLCHSYRHRLGRNLPVAVYLAQRAARLFPLIALSGIAASAHLVLRYRAGHLSGVEDYKIWFAALSALTAIPVPFLDIDNWRWPANPPLWSMFWELLASLAIGTFALSISLRSLVLGAILGSVALVVTAARAGVVGEGMLGGGALACYCFCIGIIISKAHDAIPAVVRCIGCLALVLFVALLATPYGLGSWVALVAAIVLFLPLVLIGGASISPGGGLSMLCDIGGKLSYPLYVLHFPVTHWAMQFGLNPRSVPGAMAMLVLCLSVSALAVLFYDEPVRQRLQGLDLGSVRPSRAGLKPLATTEG